MAKQNLTFGIAIKNEEKGLPRFLQSFQMAINGLAENYFIEVIFCFNGTTDYSRSIVEQWSKLTLLKKIKIIKIIELIYGNKFIAQQEIIKNKKLKGAIIFMDADTMLTQKSLHNLLSTFDLNKQAEIVYGSITPKYQKNNFLVNIQKRYYAVRDTVITTRKYFHGRLFIVRNPHLIQENPEKKEPHSFYNKLFPDLLPIVDDIYLSRFFVDRFGVQAIVRAEKSIIYFIPPSLIRDLYEGQKRTAIEIKRLDILFPKHKYLEKSLFKRKIQWSSIKNVDMQDFLACISYHTFAKVLRFVAKIHILFSIYKIVPIGNRWTELESTKYLR